MLQLPESQLSTVLTFLTSEIQRLFFTNLQISNCKVYFTVNSIWGTLLLLFNRNCGFKIQKYILLTARIKRFYSSAGVLICITS